ncbi:MAG: DUF4911 domain-containing protein [Megasphaera sp.]|jgi:hypothetical protein|nr:DUF4911 domain-containing protein [Megasphaera sp.]MCI1247680.1 DUF4911 domain-containing protein [Megasphaera sp.]
MLDTDWVYFKIAPKKMTFVTRIMEAYEYIGVVTALDGKAGIGFVRTTKDTQPLAKEVLQSLPFPVDLLTYEEAAAYAV